MNYDVGSDAVNLTSNILKSLLPNQEWEIVNIALGKVDTFILNDYPTIPVSFGYKYDKTPLLLEQHGVIEGKNPGWWYVGIKDRNSQWDRTRPQDVTLDDSIEEAAHKNKYISDNQVLEYYYSPEENIGPRTHGQMAVLVNRKKLEDFISWHSGDTPIFDINTGYFKFKGERVLVSGELNGERLKMLVDNIDKVVSKKEFYEVGGAKDYQTYKSNRRIGQLHDTLKKGFEEIEKKIVVNPKFKESLEFRQRGGFGIFIKNTLDN